MRVWTLSQFHLEAISLLMLDNDGHIKRVLFGSDLIRWPSMRVPHLKTTELK